LFQLELILLMQRGVTILLSGCNACFFLAYAQRHVRRRLGARTLALFNVALGGESLTFGLVPRLLDAPALLTTVGQFIASSLSLAVALVIAALVLRHRLRRRG
jgi:hypothetical protein